MSDESAYLGMMCRLFDDLPSMSPRYTQRDAALDRTRLIERVRTEGFAFLTSTLPALGKHLEGAIQEGFFTPISGFKREKGRTTPLFLGVWFKEVFDEKGYILVNPSANAVRILRQVCFLLYKLEADFTPEQLEEGVRNFLQVDRELPSSGSYDREARLYIQVASAIIARVFRDFDPMDIRPRPGPGASASGTPKYLRYEPLKQFRTIHEVYPYYDYFYMGTKHLLDRVRDYRGMVRLDHPISKLRFVPKDSRGPRVICMEEQEVMFLQQGLADAMRKWISEHPFTRGQVNFFDQNINRNLALSASISGEWATLDMKDASDRISRELVCALFAKVPKLLRSLLALSTQHVELPDGRVVATKKFAPMGSSLCFPIMSMVHFALGVAVMHVHSTRNTKALAKEIFVYGDDIIVKTGHEESLFRAFPLYGMIFNRGKSFVKGPFRESCGMDAFLGEEVTPQRIKRRFIDGQSPREILAALNMESLLYYKGFKSIARQLRTTLESRHGEFDFVMSGSPIVGWYRKTPSEVSCHSTKVVYNRQYQAMMYKTRVFRTAPDVSMAGGWEQMMRSSLDCLTGSQRIDERYAKQDIAWQRVPLSLMYHNGFVKTVDKWVAKTP